MIILSLFVGSNTVIKKELFQLYRVRMVLFISK